MFLKTLMSKPRPLICGALLAFSLAAQAGITLNTAPNTKLSEIIQSIQSQSGYKFFYDDDIVKRNVNSVRLKDENLDVALKKLFAGTSIAYVVKDKVIYLSLTKKKAQKENATAPKRKITGVILDENGEPLIGAVVRIKGSSVGVATDIDGNYTLETTEENPTIECTYVGYKPSEIKAGDLSTVDIDMKPDMQTLSEVVVTAFGIKRDKKMLGYAMQEVKSGELNTTGDPSVVSALDGKVAGVQMNMASTGLGGSTKITIRGNSSLTDNNQPLWIVDGVPFTDNQSSEASAFGGYDRGSTALDINPEDIESISVLKGPNAAALYGSRAGNGVILVTTKRGSKKDGFGVSYSGSFT